MLLDSCLDGAVCALLCVRAAVLYVACSVVVLWVGLAANIEGSEWSCPQTRLILPARTTQGVSQHAVACVLWPPSPCLCLGVCSMLCVWCGDGYCYLWWEWGREGRVLLGSCLDGAVCVLVYVRAAVLYVACSVVVLLVACG